MNTYKLLTPGPLTTTDTVKREMLVDRCTWDDDYKAVTQDIRRRLLELAQVTDRDYTAVLMQGSGTFGVESVLTSVVGETDKVLICSNGAYGERMTAICARARIPFLHYAQRYDRTPDAAHVAALLEARPEITHVAMVHSETTSGILNDIESMGKAVQAAGRTFIVDAMSSFAGVEIPVETWGVDFLVSSANKCIQGVPGFSFIVCRRDKLIASEGKARSLSLDLYDQWKSMEADGKWRFTSPTHAVLAFARALKELEAEGGVAERHRRYAANNRLLIRRMEQLGFATYVDAASQGPIITTFFYPDGVRFAFREFYDYIKARGYAIYPGKLTERETFRIGNIGEIYPEDIEKLAGIIADFLAEQQKEAAAV
ncbi:2-aminoethylphosphonate--pyruvate transaminase [Butyricicoccus faecihominis]|uniref:2-aminoethylphosphonate--pyruvate transaminase n=1 Tax=Butyricicoccus faecihominis TaxID=1712515 RepID=UPI0024785E02|nr:2-aminoethylphosphonate--pyruvate transaminase [Butyricicoccus faecihominis]MCQ5129203.1 2-aminoethylphosphonate--pyruvate transaminase [Butyricicoccus faecihominis]